MLRVRCWTVEQHVRGGVELQQQVQVPDIRADQQHALLHRREVDQRIQQQLATSPLVAAQLVRGERPLGRGEALGLRQNAGKDRRLGPG